MSRALIVDKDAPVRRLVRSILSGAGFDVAEADNGQEAMALVEKGPCFDLLVAELEPGETPLADAFWKACPMGRVIMTSDQVTAVAPDATLLFLPRERLADQLLRALKDLGLAKSERVVLLAEDEPLVRNLIQAVLSRAGYNVLTAADGEEALNISRSYAGPIDIMLSDIKMPRMTGPELVEHIHRERTETRILLMSGYSSGVLLQYARTQNFVRKPFASKELLEKLSGLLDSPEPGAPETW